MLLILYPEFPSAPKDRPLYSRRLCLVVSCHVMAIYLKRYVSPCPAMSYLWHWFLSFKYFWLGRVYFNYLFQKLLISNTRRWIQNHLPICFDTSWKTGGFYSNIGFGAAISTSSKKVLDYEILSRLCEVFYLDRREAER